MTIKLWQDRENEIVGPELFSEDAENLAKKIYRSKRGKANSLTQIRKFYNEILHFDTVLKERGDEEFKKQLPYIKMLSAKVTYSVGRELVTKEFKSFITDCLKQVDKKKDFDIFVTFFEAFIGFYKYEEEINKKGHGYSGRY